MYVHIISYFILFIFSLNLQVLRTFFNFKTKMTFSDKNKLKKVRY